MLIVVISLYNGYSIDIGRNKKLETIQNNFESKISAKIETNSRGFNTTVHVYQGVTVEEINDTLDKVIYASNELQKRLIGEKEDEGAAGILDSISKSFDSNIKGKKVHKIEQ